MPRNPLKDENQLNEASKGEDIVNVRTQKIVRFQDQDGNIQEFVTCVKDSIPDENGGYVNRELVNVVTDRVGNPLPEDPRSVTRSHSDLFINNPEQLASCTSRLHPANRSSHILIGQDGRKVPGGAICSRCDAILRTIYFGLAILGMGIVIGLFKAAGLFY